MTNPELTKWLRDNSSGVYRPSREAADLIDRLDRELNQAKELMQTAAIWIEACPFENAIPLSLKLRSAAMPNIRS